MFIRPARDGILEAKIAALEALQANVMVADANLNITYVNGSAMELMRNAEADLTRELPRFSVATLVGSNIDVFHRNPDHQRTMLKHLKDRHSATIRVGKHTFDLLVTPLRHDGQPTGFVVEWADATYRLRNLDYAAQIAEIGRSQTIITLSVEGVIQDANKNFLDLMGYTLDEIKGKHHRIFVEPAVAASPAYNDFWTKLGRGEFHAGRFRRTGKNGKPIWIEGSYNPIFNEAGQVVKIVKFAFDITAQMNLMASVKDSLELIDESVARSLSEAEGATRAAQDTQANVQSAAASAEQLAASTQEISSSMAKLQGAAEDVATQAAAVGSNTEAMSAAAQAMNGIVGLIRTVASQINLLALNATIEAARAGDAGKGFAVVASEVKNLAIQAAKATEQITTEIDGLQKISTAVAESIGSIGTAVGTVREQVTLTASAVEEQSAVTRGMSESMQSAAASVGVISTGIVTIAAAVRDVSTAVAGTKEASAVLAR